jgi:hypothetical protein
MIVLANICNVQVPRRLVSRYRMDGNSGALACRSLGKLCSLANDDVAVGYEEMR